MTELQRIEREHRRLRRRQWLIVMTVAIVNAVSVWRLTQLDAEARCEHSLASLVLAFASAAAMTIAVREGRAARTLEKRILLLRRRARLRM